MFLVWCHLLGTNYIFFSLFVIAEFYYVTVKSTVLIFYPWAKIVLDGLGGMRVDSALQVHLDGAQDKQASSFLIR